MKNVLLLIHQDEGQEARLQVALDLTRALSGHLTCITAMPPALVLADFGAGYAGAAVMTELREQEAHDLAALKARLLREGVPFDAEQATGDPARRLRDAPGLADIIVVSSRAGKHDSADARRIAAELAVRSGRPVMAVPPTATGVDVAGRVLVAWNGSDEANEALRAAIPLLQHAATVTLLGINLPVGALSIEEAASYLSRHGISVDVVEQTSNLRVSDVILAEARRIRPAYIVMGAFGIGRTLDKLLGGVSGSLLKASECPLFLTH